jgi:hypothetical protein
MSAGYDAIEQLRDAFDAIASNEGVSSVEANDLLLKHRNDEDFLRYALGLSETIKLAHQPEVLLAKPRSTRNRTLNELQSELDQKLRSDGYLQRLPDDPRA